MKKLKPLTDRDIKVEPSIEAGIAKISGHDKRKRREKEWTGIIIHHTGVGGRKEIDAALWKKLYKNLTTYLGKKDKNYVSAHFIIGEQGETTQIIDPAKFEAYHAGRSLFWHPRKRRMCSDWNRYAIGVELVGDGNLHRYSERQYAALTMLCVKLIRQFPTIHVQAITGHENIAPERKNDPGPLFDWKKFFKLLYVRL